MSDQAFCNRPGCDKPAAMRCPKCIPLNITTLSHFCSQECFKLSWSTHKSLHAPNKVPEHFAGFSFKGPLRPGIVSPINTVPGHIPKPDYALTGIPQSEVDQRRNLKVEVKTPEQIEGMRVVCKMAREVLDEAASHVKPGVTTDYIDQIVHKSIISRDAYPSPLNYRGFPKSCCTSVNEVVCHGIPDSRPLKDGDIVNIDITVYYKGFHGDVNATYCVGEVDEQSKKLIQVTKESLAKAIAAVKPGVMFRDFGPIIQKHVHQHGFSVVKTYCGHGIGELFHTAPSIPHHSKNKAVGVVKPGQTFTIEPMINMGHWQDELWPDDWTAVTTDGKRSAQFEHTLLATETGCEILTGPL